MQGDFVATILTDHLPLATRFKTLQPSHENRHPDLGDGRRHQASRCGGSVRQYMGIAPKLLHRRSLTARKLASAIQLVVKSPAMKKSRQHRHHGAKWDGLTTAVAMIEQYGKIDKLE